MDNTTSTSTLNHFDSLLKILEIFAWPFVVLIIVLIVKKPLFDLINRITKVGYGSTTIETQQQQSAEKQLKSKISNVDKVLGLYRNETIESYRNLVNNESDIDVLDSCPEKVERLLNYSIALYIIKQFESIYNLIFGSQLMILQQLNTFAHEDRESLKRYYDYAKEQNLDFFENYNFENYIDFLDHYELIVENKEGIGITTLGVDFLKFITETNKNINKPN